MRKLPVVFAAIVVPIALVACSSGPTDEEIRAIVREEVQAVIAEVKQGPPGEQGPLPSEQQLYELMDKVVIARKESFRGPQGLRGGQGPQGERGPQGIPGTAQLSNSDMARLRKVDHIDSRVYELEDALYGSYGVPSSRSNDIGGLRSDVAALKKSIDYLECKLRGGTLCGF